MTHSQSYEDITETLRTKGKKIVKATCITQVFPEDGAFMQVIPVDEYKSVGAILEPNRDIPVHKTWSLIPVIQIHGNPSSKLADYATIKEYLEEIIVCCKSCFEAYKKTKSDDKSGFFAVSCGSQDLWIGHNFMQVFNSNQDRWDVECIGVDSNPNNCLIDLIQRVQVVRKLDETPTNIKTNSQTINSQTTNSQQGDCFIATAAYSSTEHPDLDTFRMFRDTILLTNFFGRFLVASYYKIGPTLAKYVKKNKNIQLICRKLLSKLATLMRQK